MPLKSPRQLSQAAHSRSVNRGIAGLTAVAASAGMLAAAPAAGAHTPQLAAWLTNGTKGPTVRAVQRALHVKQTGKYSKSTKHAVVNFQKKKGLEVDGVVGPQTWDTLFHIAAPAPVTTPAPTTAPATTTPTTSTSTASGGYSIPSSIVQCESGGNWNAVNSSSGAGGAYQILPSTWAAYGGTGSPQTASPAEQSAVASRIYAAQGASAWSC